ncbi:MAG: GvpL/GvpF family gas vesicle protein [Deltaproteobacteria bacterium]|nr:GvpL/GvpF family gas vesicle protein [Deltaproteobacteria bacterium]
MEAETDERIVYLYGVVPVDQALPRDAGIALFGISQGALKAIVEPVSAIDFSPAALEKNLKSIEWVAVIARKHKAVLEQAMRHGTVIPARLCTLFSSDDAVERTLALYQERFLATLSRLKGREEWGLKVFCDEHRLQSAAAVNDPDVRNDDAAIAAASPGHAFVLRRQRDARLLELAASHLDALVEQIVEAVEQVSDDVRLRPINPISATDRPEAPVLNLAALVSISGREAFKDAMTDIKMKVVEQGLDCELTGPWAAYSFCDDADDSTPDAAGAQGG